MIGRRGFAGLVLVGAAALAVGGCRAGESPSYNYKLTVRVETPAGLRSAYSVIGVKFYAPMKGFEALSGGSVKARGEAVALDLPNGKTLFVLLSSATSGDWAGHAHWRNYPKRSDGFATSADYYQALASDTSVYPVKRWVEMPNGSKRDNYPLLVTFSDINDPTSVELVDPDDLATTFGPGYALKDMTVQVTHEAVTTGIEKRLLNFGIEVGNSLDTDFAPTTQPTLAQRLGYNDFVRR